MQDSDRWLRSSSTVVHELAHETLHKAERRITTTKIVKETEAEAIAFVLSKAVGLETGSASAVTSICTTAMRPFGRELGGNPADLRRILAALEPPAADTAPVEN